MIPVTIPGTLDPGHGGPDPRCTAEGFSEAAWVTALAERCLFGVRTWRPGIDLRLTRTDNLSDPPHTLRAQLAHDIGAEFAISLHVDANPCALERGPLAFRLAGVADVTAAGAMCRAAMRALAHRGGVHEEGGKILVTHQHCFETSYVPHHWRNRAHHVLLPYASYGDGLEERACLIEFGRSSNADELKWLKSEQGLVDCERAVLAAIDAATAA